MSEFRRDSILGNWVIMDTDRPFNIENELISLGKDLLSRSKDCGNSCPPLDIIRQRIEFLRDEKHCPFCAGNESMTKPEILAYASNPNRVPNSPDWSIRVIPNNKPILQIESALKRQADGIYDKMEGAGAHEIIIETPRHNFTLAQATTEYYENIFKASVARIRDLGNDIRFEYIYFLKKYGYFGPSSLQHPHSQIIALPVVPKQVRDEVSGSLKYFNYKERCVYCDIVLQEISDDIRIIEENENFIAFCPYASKYPFAVWIMPNEHSSDFAAISNAQIFSLAKISKTIYAKLDAALGDCPISLILHTCPLKDKKLRHYHWHIEIIPELIVAGDMDKGTGLFVNPIFPEEAAKILKSAIID